MQFHDNLTNDFADSVIAAIDLAIGAPAHHRTPTGTFFAHFDVTMDDPTDSDHPSFTYTLRAVDFGLLAIHPNHPIPGTPGMYYVSRCPRLAAAILVSLTTDAYEALEADRRNSAPKGDPQ